VILVVKDETGLTREDYYKYIKELLSRPDIKLYVINPIDGNWAKDIFRYNGKYYVNDGVDWIITHLKQEYPNISKYMIDELVYGVKHNNEYRIDRSEFNSNPYLINFENCIYDVNEGVRIPHESQYLFTTQIPTEYNPKLEYKGSEIEKFVLEITGRDKKKIKLIQEMFGYCLFKKYNIQKAFLLVGEGANGKSTLLELLIRMLGIDNVASASIEDIASGNRFVCYRMYGKLANISSEVGKKSLKSTSLFKGATGGDKLTGEQKYKDAFEFYNYAKLIFALNKVPTVIDDTTAFYRRWIPIEFSQTFKGRNCDVNILDKLTTPEQLSILLNWSIEGLHRLLDNKEFSDSYTAEDVKDWWNKQTSSVYEWIVENYTINPMLETPKDELYDAYKDWCLEESYVIHTTNGFTRALKKLFGSNVKLKQKYRGYRYWEGIGKKEVVTPKPS